MRRLTLLDLVHLRRRQAGLIALFRIGRASVRSDRRAQSASIHSDRPCRASSDRSRGAPKRRTAAWRCICRAAELPCRARTADPALRSPLHVLSRSARRRAANVSDHESPTSQPPARDRPATDRPPSPHSQHPGPFFTIPISFCIMVDSLRLSISARFCATAALVGRGIGWCKAARRFLASSARSISGYRVRIFEYSSDAFLVSSPM